MAAPDAKTPPLDAAVPLQHGGIGQGTETGDPPTFVYRGRAGVAVGGAAQCSFVPAPPPVSGD